MAAAGPDMKGLRDRALLALAYDTLCRRSELVALSVADIEAGNEGDATVLVARSKTDQEGMGMVRYIGAGHLPPHRGVDYRRWDHRRSAVSQCWPWRPDRRGAGHGRRGPHFQAHGRGRRN